MDCLDDDLCARLIDGPMPAAERRAILEHVAECESCAELVTELAAPGSEQLPGDPIAGARFGRYLPAEKLGAGASALVYRARDPALDRDVALKLLREPSPELRERMLAESRVLAGLKHPNVVTVYDVGDVGGELFVAMELVAGDLRSWVERARPGPAALLDAIWKAGRGLEALHATGLVHRDIKPENILVDSDGRVLVADLGLVEASRAPLAAGTPGYLAPEIAAGEPASRRSDQYALCVTAALMLGVEREVLDRPSAVVRALRDRGVDRRAARALARGLAAAPSARFESVAVLRRAANGGRGRRWGIAAALTMTAAAIAAAAWVAGREPLPTARCGPLASRLAAIWPGPHGQAIASRSARAHRTLAAYHRELSSLRLGACLGTLVEPAPPGALRLGACLDERAAELEATASILGRLDDEAAIEAAYTPSPPSRCLTGGFSAPPMPPELATEITAAKAELAAIRALYQAGDLERAGRRLEKLAGDDLVARYPPLGAEILHHRGAIAHDRGDYRRAIEVLEQAAIAAERAGHDEVRLRALSGLLAIPGLDPVRREALVSEIEALVDRANDPFLASIAQHRLGIAAVGRGDLEEATDRFEAVYREVAARFPADHPRVARARSSLGGVAMLRGDLEEAERQLRLALVGTRGAYGDRDPRTAAALNALASVVGERDPGAAAEMMEESIEILEGRGADHPETAQAVINLCATLIATPERARPWCERGVDIASRLDSDRTAAWALLAAGRNETEAGAFAAALAYFERAAAAAPNRPESDLELADLRYYTARALQALGREPARARELLIQVRRRWREDPRRATQIAEIDAILSGRTR